jgi:hypothetical protein
MIAPNLDNTVAHIGAAATTEDFASLTAGDDDLADALAPNAQILVPGVMIEPRS